MDIQKQMLIEQRLTNDGKSKGIAYLLWFLLGGLGLHRFYLGRTGSAFGMIALLVLGIITGGVLLLPLMIWLLVDLFLISGMVDQSRNELRVKLIQEYTA